MTEYLWCSNSTLSRGIVHNKNGELTIPTKFYYYKGGETKPILNEKVTVYFLIPSDEYSKKYISGGIEALNEQADWQVLKCTAKISEYTDTGTHCYIANEISDEIKINNKISEYVRIINIYSPKYPTGLYEIPNTNNPGEQENNEDEQAHETQTNSSKTSVNNIENIEVCYAAALATKGFVILGGLSGAGKTRLALEFAKKARASNSEYYLSELKNPSLCPVRPDWRDGKGVLGYWNPISKSRQDCPLSTFLKLQSNNNNNTDPFFLIYDEMNLARVEYYLAEVLSAMEVGSDGGIPLIVAKEEKNSDQTECKTFSLPKNLFITGTANMDDSTFPFSPKVLDRSFYIRYRAKDIILQQKANESRGDDVNNIIENFKEITKKGKRGYDDIPEGGILDEISNIISAILNNLNSQDTSIAFGYRAYKEICAFIFNYIAICGYNNPSTYINTNNESVDKPAYSDVFKHALDWAIVTKILPKFHGPKSEVESVIDKLTSSIRSVITDSTGTKYDWRYLSEIEYLKKQYNESGYAVYR